VAAASSPATTHRIIGDFNLEWMIGAFTMIPATTTDIPVMTLGTSLLSTVNHYTRK
jgi:hypothetical protein